MTAAIEGRNAAPILLVEDEPDQAQLVQDIVSGWEHPRQVQWANCGEQAIAYLAGEGPYADRACYPLPSIVLLDLKMPGIGGFGVLRWLQQHPEVHQAVNVIVLSSTQSQKDVDVVYELGARHYWPKADCGTLQERIETVEDFWGNLTTRAAAPGSLRD